MELHELTLNQLIEVKLLRLNKPKFNYQITPLTGSYNSVNNLQELEEHIDDMDVLKTKKSFDNKFQEFNLNEYSSVSIDNMFQMPSSFGKVLFCESLEGLLIINNLSDREVKIREIKVKVTNEVLEGFESMYRKTEYNLISSQNLISIPGNQFYNIKIRINADIMCKYSLEIDIQYTSSYFTEEFIKHSTNKIIKTISSHYFVEGNSSTVIKKFYKKFLFATNLPFKIKDKFINDNLEKCYIEINLINQSPYNLHIDDIFLTPDTEKMSNASANNLILQQAGFITCFQEKEFKNFNLDSDEEINIVFILNDYKTAIANSAYVVKVSWRNSFDSMNKYINYVLKNRINTYNDIFTFIVIDKPNSIYIDEFFKIIFQIQNKSSKSLKLKITKEKNSDKDFEILDIIENDLNIPELDKTNLTLICKCDVKGSVFIPKITITDENTKKTLVFEKVLNFNCLNNINLI